MKPIIKCLCDNSSKSIFETSHSASIIEESIQSILNKKQFSNIVTSNIQLYITVFFNIVNETCDTNPHVKVSEELEGDHDIYVLQCAFTNMRLSSEISSCKIFISTKDYENKYSEQPQNSGNNQFLASDPKWDLSSIILPKDVLERVMRAIAIIEYKDIIFNTLEFSKVDKSTKSILCLYGPAGTGKTITAHGIAHHLKKRIMISSYAQIESKYVGDGAKNLRAIFKAAEEQDAVLFMDEADSFLSKRLESTHSSSDKHYNRMSNELFQLLEDFNGCVIFATNLMTDVDKAFKSRIIDSIKLPLPDVEGIISILNNMVPERFLNKIFTQSELKNFAETLKGFSGRDIRKSILLSYAEIAPKIKELGIDNYVWNKDDFILGFNNVKESVEIVEELPVEEVEKFTNTLKQKNKQFDLAKHALCVEERHTDGREKEVINQLSLNLFNKPCEDDKIVPQMSLIEICEDCTDEFRNTLIDTAVRVITVDGVISETEKQFIQKLCELLCFSEERKNATIKYAISMSKAYDSWINYCKMS